MDGVLFYSTQEVSAMLGISRAQSYKIVKMLNDELKKKGFLVISGKVPKKYFAERYYGGVSNMEGGEV